MPRKLLINQEALQTLILNNFFGNVSKFADAAGLSRTHVYSIYEGKGAGYKFFKSLKDFCDNNGLNFSDYIIVE